MRAKFELGVVVGTPGALAAIREADQSPIDFLKRHARCDWGDVDEHDKAQNEIALHDGRLLSSYQTLKGEKIWIITEADRSSTCLLLPSDY